MTDLFLNDSNDGLFTFSNATTLYTTESDLRVPMYIGKLKANASVDYSGQSYLTGNDIKVSSILNIIRFNEEWQNTNVVDSVLSPAIRFKSIGFEIKIGSNYHAVHCRVQGIFSSNSYRYRYFVYLRKSKTSIFDVPSTSYIQTNHIGTNLLYDSVWSFDTASTTIVPSNLPFEFGEIYKADGTTEVYGYYRNQLVSFINVYGSLNNHVVNDTQIELIGFFTRGTDEGTFPEFYYPPNLTSANYITLNKFVINSIDPSKEVDLTDFIIFDTKSIQTVGLQATTELSIVDEGLNNFETHKSNIGKIYRSKFGNNILVEGEIRRVEPIDNNSVKYYIIGGSAKLDTVLVNDDILGKQYLIEGVYRSGGLENTIKSFKNIFNASDEGKLILAQKSNKSRVISMPRQAYSIRKNVYENDNYTQSINAVDSEAPDGTLGSPTNLFANDYENFPPINNMLGLADLHSSLFDKINFAFILDFPIVYNQDNIIDELSLNLITSHFDFAYYSTPLTLGQFVGHPEVLILYNDPDSDTDKWFKLHQVVQGDVVGSISNTNVKNKFNRFDDEENDPWSEVFDYSEDPDKTEAKESPDTSINLDILNLIQELDKDENDRKGLTVSNILYQDNSYPGDSGLENKTYIRIAVRSGDSITRNKLMIWKSLLTVGFVNDQQGNYNNFKLRYIDNNTVQIVTDTPGLINNGYGVDDTIFIIPELKDYLAELNNSYYPIELLDNLPANYTITSDFTNSSYSSLLNEVTNNINYIWFVNYNDGKIYIKKPRTITEFDNMEVTENEVYQTPIKISIDGEDMKTNIRAVGNNFTSELVVSNQPVLNLGKDYYSESINSSSEETIKEKAIQERLISIKPKETLELNVLSNSVLNVLKVGDFIGVNYNYKGISLNPVLPFMVYSISHDRNSDNNTYNIILQKREYQE